MTQWHADIDSANLSSGVKLTVASQHHVVRVVTADTLSIEAPAGNELTLSSSIERAAGSG